MGFLDRLQDAGRPKRAGAAHATVTGAVYEIWGQRGWASVDVVGESFYGAAIRAMFGSGKLPVEGKELLTEVHLVHNHLNVHDRNAVEVHGDPGLLGHLSRDDAARYAPVIDELQGRGLIATTGARVWARDGKDWNTGKPTFVASVRVDLPEPHMMVPHNPPPTTPNQLLPYGSSIHVTPAVPNNANSMQRYLCPAGECWVYATIDEVLDQCPRMAKQLAEVRIDGVPVGRLTPKMSSDLLPAVQFLAQRGLATAVRAIVKGNQLKSEVVLHAARAGDLPQEWVDGLPAATPAVAKQASGLAAAVGPVTNPIPPERAISAADVSSDPGGFASPLPAAQLASKAASAAETAAVANAPAAGWYPDPHRIARLRWWDGASWTEHTAP